MNNLGQVTGDSRLIVVGCLILYVIVFVDYMLTSIEPTPQKCIEDRLYVLQDGHWRGTDFDCKPL